MRKILDKINRLKGKITSCVMSAITAVSMISPLGMVTTVHALNNGGDYSALYDEGIKHVGAGYSYSNRLGPNTFDCSGFMDYLFKQTGIDETPYKNKWTTVAWVNALNAYDHTDTTLSGMSSVSASKGDIIVFFGNASRSAESSQHIGVLANNNTMVSAIFQGVVITSLYQEANGHTVYIPSGSKDGTYVRVYHMPSEKQITVNLNKSSANAAVTDGNSSYTLANATYGLYKTQVDAANGRNMLGKITTDANGKGATTISVNTSVNQIWCKELGAPSGYSLDGNPFALNITGNSASTAVTDVPKLQEIKVNLNKSSAVPNISNGNKNYSLENATYSVTYTTPSGNEVTLGTLATNAEGKASASYKIPLGIKEIHVKETAAPLGFCLDTETHTVTIANGTVTFDLQDYPGNDPLGITLYKKSEEDIEDPASLAGAEFTIKYYDVDPSADYTKEQLAQMKATRTWVIKTLDTGNGEAQTYLRDDCKVSGDDFYRDRTGNAVVPIGVLTCEETKAPDGYTLENSISYQLNDTTHKFEETDGVAIFKCKLENATMARVITGNEYIYTETTARGGLKIQKLDTQTGKDTQGDATNLKAQYKITNLNNYEATMKINGNIVAVAQPGETFDYLIETDEKGYWESPKNTKEKYDFLQTGKYRIDEIGSPEGYVIASDENGNETTSKEFTIGADQYVEDMTESTLGDDVIRGGFEVQKNDNDTKSAVRQGDGSMKTVFKLVNRSANSVIVNGKEFQPGQAVDVDGDGDAYFSTDDNGYYISNDQLLPYGSYDLIEVQSPEGYKAEGTLVGSFSVREDKKIYDMKFSIYNDVVTGEFSIYKHYNKQDKSEWDDKPEKGATFLAILTSKLNSTFNGDVFEAYEKIVDIIGKDLTVQGSVTEEGSEANILYKTYGITPKEFSILVTNDNGMAISTPLAYGTYSIHQINGDPDAIINDDTATFVVNGVASETEDVDGYKVTTLTDQPGKLYSVTNDYVTYQISIVKKDKDTGKTVAYNGASFKLGYDADGDGKWTEADRKYSKKFTDYNKVVNGYVVQTVGEKEYDVFRTYTGSKQNLAKGTFVVDTATGTDDDLGKAVTPIQVAKGTYFIFEADNDKDTVNETPWGYVTADPDSYDINGSLYNKSDNHAKYPVAGEVQVAETHYAVLYDGSTSTAFADDTYEARADIYDKRALGELTVHKTIEKYDADKSLIDRKDLSAFGFELRAAEDIIDPADGSVITKKGDIAKTIVDKQYVESGKFHVDKDGNFVLSNIPLGKYVLTETEHPKGIVSNDKTYDVEFVQPENDRTAEVFKAEVNIENLTTKTAISKKAVTGDDELPGAKLTVTDAKGNVIDSWTSTKKEHVIEGLTAGKEYTLTEETAPDGFVKASSIKFTVSDSDEVETVKMVDKVVNFKKSDVEKAFVKGAKIEIYATDENNKIATDEDGNNIVVDSWTSDGKEHKIKNLEVGKSYVARELEAPEGYVTASDIFFTVEDDGKDQDEVMVDMIVEVFKKDVEIKGVEGAKLEILDENGKVVDSWTSAKEAHRANGLKVGKTYTLREAKAPKGYALAKDIVFTVDDDGANKAEIMINKKVTMSKVDVAGKEVEGAKMSVTDLEGNVIDSWTSGKEAHEIENLVVGETYILNEDVAAEGYVKASSVTFTVEDNNKNQHVEMIDKTANISKKDVAGDEVKGATMSVTDEDGTILDMWKSDGTEHKISNLEEGKTYTIHEKVTADGYVKATDIEFTVTGADENGRKEDQHINVIDKLVSVSKVDMGGKEIKGAKMSVTDEHGTIVDKWESDGTEHRINGLEEGKSYVLHEETAPKGYVKATDIPFEVSGADDKGVKVDQHIDMTDKVVSLDKTDGEGHEVEGAIVTITDENRNVVDKWTSGKEAHNISNLEAGKKYTWHEDYSEDIFGYYYAEDYTFEVTDDGIDQKLEMVDSPIRYSIAKVDDNGNYVKGVSLKLTDVTDPENPVEVELPNNGKTTDKPFELDKKLCAEHKYTLVETDNTEGVHMAESIEFVVPKFGTPEVTTINMHDANNAVTINKVDNYGNPVKGAKLQIIEAELEAGKPEATTDNEVATQDIENNVSAVTTTPVENDTVTDENAVVSKPEDGVLIDSEFGVSDSEMKYVPVKDENGNDKVVYEFESTDDVNGVDISNYVKGDHTYILRETEAPFGFNKIEDQLFTVTGTAEKPQVIMATDSRQTYFVSAVKVDKADHSKLLKNAEITLFNADGTVAKDVNGKKCVGLTDGKGVITWNVEYSDEGYYVQETNAPLGYKINRNKYKVELSNDFFESEKKAYQIVVEDEIKSVTGVGMTTGIAAAGLIGVAGIGVLSKKNKKKEDNSSAE